MLTHLSIKNYILINELDMEFKPGFSAITGETGAGKSILVGALSLVLGKRADTDVLLNKTGKCIIEGTFNADKNALIPFFEQHDLDIEHQLVLRREINHNGKSRAFINDTPVRLPLMKELGEKLVDIHSQHETLLLNESDFQLAVLDNYADNKDMLAEYREEYDAYIQQRDQLQDKIAHERKIRAEEEFIRFQYEEIEKAGLQDGELQGLEEEQEVLANAEEIKGSLYHAVQMLHLSEDSLLERLSGLISVCGKVSDYHKEIKELKERLVSSEIELKDIGNALSRLEEDISFNPVRHEEVSERIDLIYSLLQKHNVKDITALLRLKVELQEKLGLIENIDDEILQLKKDVEAKYRKLTSISDDLHNRREAVIPALQDEVSAILMQLGMEKVVIKVMLIDINELSEWG
ncbi:MAG: DNA repair protein RecN, partial [Bacteroidota bacterium]